MKKYQLVGEFEGEKCYVEVYYYKYYVVLDLVLFYCSLCYFMGKIEREVFWYIKGYCFYKLVEENFIF